MYNTSLKVIKRVNRVRGDDSIEYNREFDKKKSPACGFALVNRGLNEANNIFIDIELPAVPAIQSANSNYPGKFKIIFLFFFVENKTLGQFGHVTRFRYLNGVLDNEVDLTPSATWVHKIHGINEVKRVVYYTASPPGEPSQKQLYEVSLEVPKFSEPQSKCVSCELKSPEGMCEL